MLVERSSMLTGKFASMELNITIKEVADYDNGALLQNAFPNLNADEREFYKTGITAEEWEVSFGEED